MFNIKLRNFALVKGIDFLRTTGVRMLCRPTSNLNLYRIEGLYRDNCFVSFIYRLSALNTVTYLRNSAKKNATPNGDLGSEKYRRFDSPRVMSVI